MPTMASTPEVGPRAVRGAAAGLELRPHEALVRDARAQMRRLGDDARVGAPAAQDRLDALAGVLLVGHRADDHVAAQPVAGGRGARHHDRGQAALHVVGPAAVEASVADHRLVRTLHPVDVDGVQVRVEHQRRAAAGAPRDADDARPAGERLVDGDVEPPIGEPRGDEGGDLGLAGPARHERRVDGVDRHELRRAGRSSRVGLVPRAPRAHGQHRFAVRLQSAPVLPEIRELRYFVAVAEERRFTHAAERLYITQQSLSAAIAQLERRLGVELFVRDRQGLRLTPGGEALLTAARGILAQAASAVDDARRAAGAAPLRVGYAVLAASELTTPILTHLQAAEPQLEIQPAAGRLRRSVRRPGDRDRRRGARAPAHRRPVRVRGPVRRGPRGRAAAHASAGGRRRGRGRGPRGGPGHHRPRARRRLAGLLHGRRRPRPAAGARRRGRQLRRGARDRRPRPRRRLHLGRRRAPVPAPGRSPTSRWPAPRPARSPSPGTPIARRPSSPACSPPPAAPASRRAPTAASSSTAGADARRSGPELARGPA